MDTHLLESTARQLVREGHGILAADDRSAKRYTDVGLPDSEDVRRNYREMLVTSPKARDVLSGVILCEETFYQKTTTGEAFPAFLQNNDILPGIKLDGGLEDLAGFPGEKITLGLDTLTTRAAKFSADGARFAKWRNVIAIGDGIPTDECIGSNTYILARYARICQDHNIVPIVEPEVLIEGNHSAEDCERVTAHVYDILFQTLKVFRVYLPGCVMKTAMVVTGNKSGQTMDPADVAERTVRVLANHVPNDLGGVVFLSGGETTSESLVNLNRIEQQAHQLPFDVTFSYLRSLQDPALHMYADSKCDTEKAQTVFDALLTQAQAARNGQLDESSLIESVKTSSTNGVWEY